MDSTTFIPMYDLEHLDETQKATYYRDACNFLGIPANLNLLAYIEMLVGDSGRHLVLYAKKGATDLIRKNRGISTTSLEAIKDLVPGQVCFVAVGKDAEGREERAVGTASIEGLRGKDLSDAIMTAQTRATRRMTLQFVGGGILDESELSPATSSTISLPNNSALDAITIQPVVTPNATPSVVEPPSITDFHAYPTMAETFEPTPIQKAAQDALAAVNPDVLAAASGEKTFKTVAELAATLPVDNPLSQLVPPAVAPKQRKRKSTNEVTLSTPAQESQSTSAQTPVQNLPLAQASTATPAQIAAAVAALPPAATVQLPAQPVEPPKEKKVLEPEEEKIIKERLGKYRNEILPMGGMVPVDKLGGVEMQLRTFVGKFNPEKKSSKTWNFQDWTKFLDFFDDIVKTHKAEGLVKYIQQAIGII